MPEGAWMSWSFSRYYLPLALKRGLVALESRWYRSHNWYGIIESEQTNGMNYLCKRWEFYHGWDSLKFSFTRNTRVLLIWGEIWGYSILALSIWLQLCISLGYPRLLKDNKASHTIETAQDSHSNSSWHAFLPSPLIHFTCMFLPPLIKGVCETLYWVFHLSWTFIHWSIHLSKSVFNECLLCANHDASCTPETFSLVGRQTWKHFNK